MENKNWVHMHIKYTMREEVKDVKGAEDPMCP